MAASYPTSIKSNFSTKAHGHVIYASHITDIEDEVIAIETALKTGPTVLAAASFSGAVTLTGGLNTPLVVAQGGTGLAGGLTGICEGRLTLTSGTAVTTADVTGATNIYFAPYAGNEIALYDGSSAWNIRTFTQITIALGTLTDAKPYDLFAYDNSGTVTFDSPVAWTNDTTRATALTTQDGVLVKTGATTRRYIGTFYTTATTTTEDSMAKRFVWNYYNRVSRPMRVLEATDTWTYTIATIRQANGSTANQLAFIVGVAEVELTAIVIALTRSSTSNVTLSAGVGLDSTTAAATGTLMGNIDITTASRLVFVTADLRTYPAAGYHFAAWLEYSHASGTTTWWGDGGNPTVRQSGISGSIDG
jgi:hypothetical protein